MHEGSASNGDVELYWVAEGDVGRPTVLLINGGGSTLPLWCREMIDPMLDAGFRVVRFDNRDIGRSTWLPGIEYDVRDMAHDAAAVLDAVGVETAHILGRSLGGVAAQWVAMLHPHRVASLTLVYTTPGLIDERLPQPQASTRRQSAAEAQQPSTDDDRRKIRIGSNKFYCGTRYPFDKAWAVAEADAEVAHAPWNLPGHFGAVRRTPSLVDRLGEIDAPTLVLHGDEDPIVPVEHGRFLGANVPGAEYHEFAGLSHELPPAFCVEIAPLLLAHFRDGQP